MPVNLGDGEGCATLGEGTERHNSPDLCQLRILEPVDGLVKCLLKLNGTTAAASTKPPEQHISGNAPRCSCELWRYCMVLCEIAGVIPLDCSHCAAA